MLFKLSLKNIRKGVRDYAIYFVTLVLGIAIFYVFNAIETQASFLKVTGSTADALELMSGVITGLSVFIAFVLGFLIVYASRFLMKRRNREFALYMTLGMSKGSIAGIISIESIAVGIFSLAAGLLVGIGFSQLMSTFVAQMFEADMTEFVFTFSQKAFFKTILYFGIIMLVVVLFDMILVGKARLIQLLQTGSRSEKIKVKNPVLCVILFLVGAGCLAFAYWMTNDLYRMSEFRQILIPILVGIVGTFLIFWSLSGLFLTIISRIRSTYYKGLNCFTFRQLSGRINTMVVSITVICVMLFFTIAILSAAFSIRSSLNSSFKELTPVDVDLSKKLATSETIDDLIAAYPDNVPEETIRENYSMDMEEILREAGIDPDQMFGEYISVDYYGTNDFTLEDAFGSFAEEIRAEYPSLMFNSRQVLMTVDDYNRVAELFGREPIELGPDEYAIVCNADVSTPEWNKVLAGGETISLFGHELHPGYSEVQYGFTKLSSIHEETGLFIIPTEAADPEYRTSNQILANYSAADDAGKEKAEEQLREVVTKINEESGGVLIYGNTRLDIRGSAVSLGAVVTFLGLYLGFVFLISGAAILALKALSDSIDSTGRYHMLRQLGTDENMLTSSLLKQQGILFLLPLVLALIHSVFGIRFTTMVLNTMGIRHSIGSMILTAAILILIYAGYFVVTFLSSKRIIREEPMQAS